MGNKTFYEDGLYDKDSIEQQRLSIEVTTS